MEEKKTSAQIRAEIDSHLKGKGTVETTLPQSIVIGPFHVNTDSVRLALAKKHKDIARALLDFLVTELRKETEEVCMCACVRACMHACVRGCVRACVHVRTCMCQCSP